MSPAAFEKQWQQEASGLSSWCLKKVARSIKAAEQKVKILIGENLSNFKLEGEDEK